MIIAIHKDDPDRWVQCAKRFPLEAEVLEDYYLFETNVDNLEAAVRIARALWAREKNKVKEVL